MARLAKLATFTLALSMAIGHSQAQPYTSEWESLDSRPVPEWFENAKFGIFIHWGIYSVPAWTPRGTYSEWYQYWLETKTLFGNGQFHGREVYDYHRRTYGPDFSYYDFGERFQAELYDPEAWAKLFKKSGAKYVVLTSKHHDGFALWPSAEAGRLRGFSWNSVETGPRRDLVGEYVQAVRQAGLKAGLYYSLYEWFHPLYRADPERYVEEHMLPQLRDLVKRYRPDILWADGEWEHPAETWKSAEFLQWLYNESPAKETVVVNDRWGRGDRHTHGGYFTSEYETDAVTGQRPWEECRGMGLSFGYNRDERIDDYNSSQTLVLLLLDVVSRGGNLLLDIGPRADGRIPVIMQERLEQIGRWLDANGEAIYGTRRWRKSVQWSEGRRDYEFKTTPTRRYIEGDYILKQTVDPDSGWAVKNVFFTQKDRALYAISPKWPGRELVLKGLRGASGAVIELLGVPGELDWVNTGSDLIIQLPAFDPAWGLPSEAYAFKISSFEE